MIWKVFIFPCTSYRHTWIYLSSIRDMESRASLKSTEEMVPPPLSDSELYHVFLSSSSSDQDWTHSLMEQLEARGLKMCFHERDFTPGRTILENMSESIRQSQKVLLVLSPDFVRSRWCLLEANMSLFTDCLRRKPIVPVLLKPVDIPLHLSHLTYLEVTRPSFIQELIKVLCMPNHQLQGSTVVPYQPPTIYNSKTLQPLSAVNKERLEKYDCGIWSEMDVPDQLGLIIRDPQRYLQAIGIINTVHRDKVQIRSMWSIVPVLAVIILFSSWVLFVMLLIYTIIENSFRAVKIVFLVPAAAIFIWLFVKIFLFEKNEVKRLLTELQKAVGRANTLLFEDNVLLGSDSRTQLHVVYVCVNSCRQELGEDKETFDKALLDFSSDYACCLAQRHFPFALPTEPGHLERGVCFCQYVLQMNNMEQPRSFSCCYSDGNVQTC